MAAEYQAKMNCSEVERSTATMRMKGSQAMIDEGGPVPDGVLSFAKRSRRSGGRLDLATQFELG